MDSFKEIIGKVVIFAIVLFIVSFFKRKKEWEFEAKLFSDTDERPFGKFEIEKFKGRAPMGELTLYGSKSIFEGSVKILVNDHIVSKFQVSNGGKAVRLDFDFSKLKNAKRAKRKSGSFFFPIDSKINFKNHDKVLVQVQNLPDLSGVLVWD